jgi:nucleoside-diphosphate-sugar epimerase
MKVLVTGHLGYVGTVLTPMLAEAGHHVVGLDCGYYRDSIVGPLPDAGVSRRIVKDMRDVDRDDVEGCDAVVHLAALSNDPTGDLNPGLTEAINLRSSQRLAELAKAAGVSRFLFASSCSIYGQSAAAALTEDSPMNPLTAYARSKVEFEKTLAALADDRFSPLSLRNATAYGFSPRLRVDLVVNNLVASAMTTGEVRLLSDGTAWRPLLHVDDMSRAFVAALSADRRRWHNLALNVGREEDNYQIRAVAAIVAGVVPGSVVSIASGAVADTRNYNVSFQRIRDVLPEWQPRFVVPAGTEHLYDAMLRAGFSREDFTGPQCSRLRQLLDHQSAGRLDQELRWIVHAPAAVTAGQRR